MEVRIESHLAASLLLEQEPGKWDSIIILDSRHRPTDFAAQRSVRHLSICFDDIQVASPGRRALCSEDFQTALNFAQGSEKLLLSCRAGQSRSVALGFCLAHHYLGAEKALDLLRPGRHAPNRWVIEIARQVFEDSSVEKTFLAWEQLNRGQKISDHLDEIEAEITALEQMGAVNRFVETP